MSVKPNMTDSQKTAVKDSRTVAGEAWENGRTYQKQLDDCKKIVRYGVEWSNDGKHWLAIVNDKTLEEGRAHFNANTAKHKRFVKHEIAKTYL